jgi:pimeloyl-ACP methyl ester carboxylesterase
LEDEATIGKMMMQINRSQSIDSLAFTAVITVASRTLILRDRLLGRVKRTPLEDDPCLEISRHTICSGKQFLDAVFVAPTRRPARAAVLLCHGIGETVDHWLGVQKLLAAQGIASLVFDYTGYGTSIGRIRWKQCEEDTIEAFGALEALLPDTSVSMLGFSLGSGIAAAVLDYISPQKLILCSSFTSFQAAACCAGLPRGLSFLAPPIWNTEASLCRFSLPVLILHCENDRLFPIQMASKLASSCKERAKLVIVPHQRHNDPFYRPDRQYWDHVISMLVSDVVRELGEHGKNSGTRKFKLQPFDS